VRSDINVKRIQQQISWHCLFSRFLVRPCHSLYKTPCRCTLLSLLSSNHFRWHSFRFCINIFYSLCSRLQPFICMWVTPNPNLVILIKPSEVLPLRYPLTTSIWSLLLCLILFMSKTCPRCQNYQNYILCLYFLTPVLNRKGLHVLKEVVVGNHQVICQPSHFPIF